MGIFIPKPKNSKYCIIITSTEVKLKTDNPLNVYSFVNETQNNTAKNTKNDPICVHITKYIDDCIDVFAGLIRYTKKNDGTSNNS